MTYISFLISNLFAFTPQYNVFICFTRPRLLSINQKVYVKKIDMSNFSSLPDYAVELNSFKWYNTFIDLYYLILLLLHRVWTEFRVQCFLITNNSHILIDWCASRLSISHLNSLSPNTLHRLLHPNRLRLRWCWCTFFWMET